MHGDDTSKDETVDELRDHLLETAASLEARGVESADAELVAVARLGDAAELAGGLSRERRRGVARRAWRAGSLAALIAAAAFAAAVIIHPVGNDRGLAQRLERLETSATHPRGTQEPSGQEVAGVPVPQGVDADAFAQELAARMAILD